ncbi:MAG TPA: Gfo/Idh/MocA family oxidoreductase [Clostridiaceae bacterium]|nr:Gfo/Idh/MocA family oxidoreductase [Clostridiaceae bacterium]
MRKLKILIIGSAFGADLHADAYNRIREKIDIVGISGRDLDRVRAFAKRHGFTDYTAYDDYSRAIEECDCDLVDICVPNFLHHDVAIKALERGRDIICEKPLTTTVEEAQDMINTAERLGKRIYYAEDWIFAPAFRKAMEIIESGKVGKPLYVRARECHSGSHSPFAQTIEYCGGGSMIHLGVHPVSYLLAMKNNEWSELVAMTSGGLEGNLVHRTMEGEDWAGVFIRFKDGTFATIEANYITTGGMEDVMDIYCEQGVIHIDLSAGPIRAYSIPGLDYTIEKAEITTGWSTPAVDEKHTLGYAGEIEHFVDCALAGVDAEAGLRGIDGLETMKVISLIYKSACEGIAIKNE